MVLIPAMDTVSMLRVSLQMPPGGSVLPALWPALAGVRLL
jgi:hypothetical protein